MTFDPELAQAIILDHHSNPRHRMDRGSLVGFAGGEAKVLQTTNPLCGDIVWLAVGEQATADGGLEFAYAGSGCAVSQAGASVLVSQLQGLGSDAASSVLENYLAMMDGEPACSELPEHLRAFGVLRDNAARRVCAELAAKLAILVLAGRKS